MIHMYIFYMRHNKIKHTLLINNASFMSILEL